MREKLNQLSVSCSHQLTSTNSLFQLVLLVNLVSYSLSVPQQIFIPGLSISNRQANNVQPQVQQTASPVQQQQQQQQPQQAAYQAQPQPSPQQAMKQNDFGFNFNEIQLNDLYNFYNSKPLDNLNKMNANQYYSNQNTFMSNNNEPNYNNKPSELKKIVPQPDLLEKSNTDFERYFSEVAASQYSAASSSSSSSSASSYENSVPISTMPIYSTTPVYMPVSSTSTPVYMPKFNLFTTSIPKPDYEPSSSTFELNNQNNDGFAYTRTYPIPDDTANPNNNNNNNNAKQVKSNKLMSPFLALPNNGANNVNEYVYSNSPVSINSNAADSIAAAVAAAAGGVALGSSNPNPNNYNVDLTMKTSNQNNGNNNFFNNLNVKETANTNNNYHEITGLNIFNNNNNNNPNNYNPPVNTNNNNNNYNSDSYKYANSYVYNKFDLAYNDCSDKRESKTADTTYCNLYHKCYNGVYKALLCPEGYLFSTITQNCEKKSQVECGKRYSVEFDHTNVPFVDYMNDYYNSAPVPRIVNGSLECSLGIDGYFADPEFCNIYHHCLAGVDYAEQCPHQLVWNDRKKMCDWQTSVNCTGRIIPVAQGQTSFCTDKSDNKYPDAVYCNVFHHCVGGIDNVVRCDGELQWNDKDKKCDWESMVKCMGKMLPSEKHYNSTFCIGKPDGPYAHEEYCNVYHVCESGTDNIRQCPNQLFWDYKTKRCDWSGNVECTGRTLITLSTESTLFCMERRDGVYGDPNWCNVYHNCLSGVDFKTKCPDGLIWNETKKDCDWSDSTQCATGNVLRDSADLEKKNFCTDKPNGKYPHEMHCNRYYVCQNGKDIIFTCQNNLRYNATKQECDWAVNVNCFGKQDYMWEGIKENFCKNKPDGNYPDAIYCNIFHQCQAATDYPKRCSNRLMFHEEKGECDWEDQVDCKGKDKLIETSGLQDESKPETSGDGKGRVTKFCMTKENGNYADLYYCNVYHNCHGGFDTVQYCANGLVWRQDTSVSGTCDWPLSSKITSGVDCGMKKIFLIDKQSQVDIMATLRSDFCISRGEGLFSHTKYCDLYIHCTAQAVAITMECSPGLIFNENKRECDYLSDDQLNLANNSYCPPPKQILRPKPRADGTLMFNGNDVTGKFPTKFTCEQKPQQLMYNDDDWCNIYHVCAGPRDNIFICPPGTIFSKQKQGCFDRYTTQSCSGSINYYKPNLKKPSNFMPPSSNYDIYYN